MYICLFVRVIVCFMCLFCFQGLQELLLGGQHERGVEAAGGLQQLGLQAALRLHRLFHEGLDVCIVCACLLWFGSNVSYIVIICFCLVCVVIAVLYVVSS